MFLRMEVIAMTVLEVLALLNLLCVIVFGILGYIKKNRPQVKRAAFPKL